VRKRETSRRSKKKKKKSHRRNAQTSPVSRNSTPYLTLTVPSGPSSPRRLISAARLATSASMSSMVEGREEAEFFFELFFLRKR